MSRFREIRWPLLVFIVALLPRLIRLGARPFWLDEVFTLQRASLAPAALVHDSFLNHHMPSFFLMLSPLIALGDPQFWLRLPSAMFGALAVVLVFLIANRIAGRTAGIIAALILGLSPTALAFSQEARSYTLEMSLILVALYGITQLALDIPAASQPLRARRAWPGWAAFILGSAAALDVLGDGLPWLITANVIGAALVLQSPARKQLLKNFVIADLIIGALLGAVLRAHAVLPGLRLHRQRDVDPAARRLARLVRFRLGLLHARGRFRDLPLHARARPRKC